MDKHLEWHYQSHSTNNIQPKFCLSMKETDMVDKTFTQNSSFRWLHQGIPPNIWGRNKFSSITFSESSVAKRFPAHYMKLALLWYTNQIKIL